MKIQAFTIDDIPLIKPGDDLAELILRSCELEDKDIIVIASTIISKSEGRFVRLDDVRTSEDARFVELVLRESAEILIRDPFLLTQLPNGYVCTNAGIDRSNIANGYALLLPKEPDESANRIRNAIYERTGKKISVIISDTSGRAFRIGQTGVAIGCTGIPATRDWRGEKDVYGHILQVTNEAIIDELAGLANLLMGEADDMKPVVIIRGFDFYDEDRGNASELIRSEDEDMIKKALRNKHE